MGRSMSHLIEMIQKLEKRRVGFHSLTEKIDTTTAGGRLIFHLFGALAEFERDLIRERVVYIQNVTNLIGLHSKINFASEMHE